MIEELDNIYFKNNILPSLSEKFKEPDGNLKDKYKSKFKTLLQLINEYLNKPNFKFENYKEIGDLQYLDLDEGTEKERLITKIGTEDKPKDGFYLKIRFIYDIFVKKLPQVLTKQNRRDFGLLFKSGYSRGKVYKYNNEIINKSNHLAIPFRAIDDPVVTSEFSDKNIVLIYTILSHVLNNSILREKEIDIYLQELYKFYLEESIEYWKTSIELKNYQLLLRTLTNYTAQEVETLDFIQDHHEYSDIKGKIKNRNEINSYNLYGLIKNIIISYLDKYLSQNSYQYNITFSDITQSDLRSNYGLTGFSGTPYFETPFDRIEKNVFKNYQ